MIIIKTPKSFASTAITIFVGPRLRVVGGRHGEIKREIIRGEGRGKQRLR